MADTMSPAEVALMDGHDGMLSGDGAFFWIFALLILAGGNFGFGGGNRGDYVTNAQLTDQLSSQNIMNQLQQLSIQSANNNYETAQLVSAQTNTLIQQNNTNLINAIQGFNQLGQKIDQLGYHMDQCCCEIKTQMLQNRLDDAQAALVAAQNNISNANQSQYILSQLGRFVAWTPSGTQAATAA